MAYAKRFLHLSASIFGSLGLLICVAAAAGVWVAYDRARTTTNTVFAKIDDAFDGVGERIGRTQSRVEESKLTTEGVRQSLAEWSKQEARDRVATTLRVRERSQRLSESLAKADESLAVSESSAELVLTLLAAAYHNPGDDPDEDRERLPAKIAAVRQRLAQAIVLSNRVAELTADDDPRTTLDERLREALRVVVRLLASFGTLDTHLADLRARVGEKQEEIRRRNRTALGWILVAAVAGTALTAWAGAGQYCLFLCGRKGLFQRRQVAFSSAASE